MLVFIEAVASKKKNEPIEMKCSEIDKTTAKPSIAIINYEMEIILTVVSSISSSTPARTTRLQYPTKNNSIFQSKFSCLLLITDIDYVSYR